MYISILDHRRSVTKIHCTYVLILLITGIIMSVSLYFPFQYKSERNLLISTIETLRLEYLASKAQREMIETLRSKPLTISQALDISDAILQQQHVPVEVILAIIKQESQFIPTAVSHKGAKGLMQIMPGTWKIFTDISYKQVYDPVKNINIGAKYLADLYSQYGDWKMVFRAYFAGPKNAKNRKYDWYANAVLKKMEVD